VKQLDFFVVNVWVTKMLKKSVDVAGMKCMVKAIKIMFVGFTNIVLGKSALL